MFELNYKVAGAGLATLLVGFFTYFTVKIYILRLKYKHIPGPSSDGLLGFYFGNFPEFLRHKRRKNGLHNDLFLEWYQISKQNSIKCLTKY